MPRQGDNNVQAAKPGFNGTDGSFASPIPSADELGGLHRTPKQHITVSMLVEAPAVDQIELPEWPEQLPFPTIDVDNGSEHEGLQTYISVGGASAHFYGNAAYSVEDSIENSSDGQGDGDWDGVANPATLQQIRRFGRAVHRRNLAIVASATEELLNDESAKAQLIAAASGRPVELSATTIDRSTERAARILEVVSGSGVSRQGDATEDDTSALQDALSDLMHYAHARGIDWGTVSDSAKYMFEDEIHDPTI
ncbi:hypothetical protein [Leifsonia sp. Leaf264]|uniref:hypothetical protein n=1 Tax=Leifsonia sp. Leaf264 TaxID=1736314 RepID=UPI0006FA27BE|nr:hypothetical protein [Leifsonia sp. Leaf264]KQO98668.1 hypothetical protein ASF30_11440 [Leifsonia sp. Leaf264]